MFDAQYRPLEGQYLAPFADPTRQLVEALRMHLTKGAGDMQDASLVINLSIWHP